MSQRQLPTLPQVVLRVCVTLFATSAGMIALVLIITAIMEPGGDRPDRDVGSVSVGETQFMGRRNCDRAIQGQLRDPSSYERISAQIVDVKPGAGWVAEVQFRARNGFGGYGVATAQCLHDGASYRALLSE
jgi:hypothetical protein